MGEERRSEVERGKGEVSLSQQFSKVGAYGASRPADQCQASVLAKDGPA